jgi:hypothetical protein
MGFLRFLSCVWVTAATMAVGTSCNHDSDASPPPKSARISSLFPGTSVPDSFLTILGMPSVDWDDEGLVQNYTTLKIPLSWDGKRIRISGACIWSDSGSVGQRTLILYSPDTKEFDIQTLPPDPFEFHGNKVSWVGLATAGWRIQLQAYQTSGQAAAATSWLFIERMN